MQDEGASLVGTFFKKWWVRGLLIVDVILVIAIVAVAIVQANKSAVINFEVTPLDAEISLNGRGGYRNGENRVLPGEYQVKIMHEGMEAKSMDVKVGVNDYVTITTFLRGEDGGFGYYELKDNLEDYERLAEIAGAEDNRTWDNDTSAEEFLAGTEQVLSISEVLPIKGYVYADPEVSYSTAGFAIRDAMGNEQCEKIACLLVKYYGTDYEATVMEKIKEAGYNPADYQIVYERYD